MKIEIEKTDGDGYLIKLDGAMVTVVSKKDLMTLCEEIKNELS